MAIVSKHLGGTLRITDSADQTVHSYHRIRPNIQAANVENFMQGVGMLRGQTGGNAFLTISTELMEDEA